MAGTVGGWAVALDQAKQRFRARLPLSRLLQDAIYYARHGFPVTPGQSAITADKRGELQDQPGFRDAFMPGGEPPIAGQRMRQERLAATLDHLAETGLDSFYRGDLATSLASDLQSLGSPLALEDFHGFHAKLATPVTLDHERGQLYNMTLPTQGPISLAILGIAERAGLASAKVDSADYVHCLVEATKQAFALRDRMVVDPAYAPVAAQEILTPERLQECADRIDPQRAQPWGAGHRPSDTIWMGAIDQSGLAVSFIQSIYHEYGSGIVLAKSGINWQNRGSSFRLDPKHLLALLPGKKPFHTLNPALARLKHGGTLVYGTMGGDGQPQTQAAVFSRHAIFGQSLQQAITAPRWLLGRTWGQASDTLKIESRFGLEIIEDLRARGHDVEPYPDFSETMGHAGALLRHPNGVLEGATDPRSNGGVAGF
jgi:gamma-glutamyltranspeptidase/glutathione hydrolase